jgi:hypothetical protein
MVMGLLPLLKYTTQIFQIFSTGKVFPSRSGKMDWAAGMMVIS